METCRGGVPEVSFVPFFFLWINPCGAVFTHRVMPQHMVFVVIRMIQVMIEIDHVKMEVIVECVYVEVGRSQGRGQGWLCSKTTRPDSSGYRCVNLSLRRQLDPFMA